MKRMLLIAALACSTSLSAQPSPQAEELSSPDREASKVSSLAQLYYKNMLRKEPERAYFSGVTLDRHDQIYDNSPRAYTGSQSYESWMLRELQSFNQDLLVGRVEWITYAYMLEDLVARAAVRVCQPYLWNINQMGGWHTMYPRIAELQPVENSIQRQQAMIRWKQFPAFIDMEISNATLGLQRGYSAPKSVVRRVIEQVEGLLAIPLDESQLSSPARRSDDAEFAAEFTALVENEILPAYQRYLGFLQDEYLPNAREALSVLNNPKGRQCYEGSLRAYTTLDRSPEEVFELGQQTVAANIEQVQALGMATYGISDFAEIMARIDADAADKFSSADELLAFSRDTVTRAQGAMPEWFATVPNVAAVVEPFPAFQEGTGVSARYEPGDGTRPGIYRIPLFEPQEQSRGRAETTAFHEVWPGHHLQVAIAQTIDNRHPLTDVLWFSGSGEGWARYSEALSAEIGLYQTETGPIQRLAWPARGMVVDPGIHIFDWSREQAMEFMGQAGRMSDEQLSAMVDRIAILPGQLTAYDSGGLEIMALRAEAETALGEHFDIRKFHDAVLKSGTLPLMALRIQVESWIAAEQAEIAAMQAAEAAEE